MAETTKAFEAQARAVLDLNPSRGSLEYDLRERQRYLAPLCLPRTAKAWWKSLMRVLVFTDSPLVLMVRWLYGAAMRGLSCDSLRWMDVQRMSDVNTACDTSVQWYVPLTELLQPHKLDATAAIQLLPAFAALAREQMKQPDSPLPFEHTRRSLASFVSSVAEPKDVWRGVLAVLQDPPCPPPELKEAFEKVWATLAPVEAAAEAAAARVRAAEAELQRATAALEDARAMHDTLRGLLDRSVALKGFPLLQM